MGLFKQSFEKQESINMQRVSDRMQNQLTDKQINVMNSITDTLKKEKNDEKVLTVNGLEEFHSDEMQAKYTEKYKAVYRGKDANASDRTIRERAEKKASDAMKMRKKLQELCASSGDFKDVVDSNFTIYRINSFKKKNNPTMSAEDEKKVKALKKQAPKVYTRYLQLTRAFNMLTSNREKYPELYSYAERELDQATREWEYVQQMSQMVKFTPIIDSKKEAAQLKARAAVHGKDRKVTLDETYKKDLAEHLKPKNIKWNIDYKTQKNNIMLQEKYHMDIVLAEQMDKIIKEEKEANNDVSIEQVEELVNEYLAKVADSSALRIRVSAGAVAPILNSRYHSSKDDQQSDYYSYMQKMQFSWKSKEKTYNTFSFGILGSKDAKGFSGNGSTDTCSQYGNVSLRLNKEKMRGRATFMVGNSMGNLPKLGYNFYNIKHGRSVFTENGVKPDIAACGANLYRTYKRAKALKANNWKDLLSPEKEALEVAKDKKYKDAYIQQYFEAQFHGQVGPGEVDEVTMIMSKKDSDSKVDNAQWDFSKKEDLMALKKNKSVRDIYDTVNIINKNPKAYDRVGMEEMKVTLWDCHGNTLSYDDLKFIMES